MRKIEFCYNCQENTDDYYPIQTNKGKEFLCAPCYEILHLRAVRNEYARNPVINPLKKVSRRIE
jgi:hypothetical protein